MNNFHKQLVLISRILIGIVFIYSGFAKGLDPLGSTYKFNDYFNAFGMHWATSLSFTLAIILSAFEFVVGFAVLLNLRIKLSSIGALLLMGVFTPLTFVLALTNPVSDCGCFGDALILTNWETFIKNVFICIPTVYLFVIRKKIENSFKNWEQWLGVAFATVIIFWVSIYSYKHLPVIDFRPYNIGTHIPDGMTIPEGAPADQWESIFIYKKDGVEKEFGMNNLPDSTWTFVDAQHKLIKKGYEPPIHDFTIVDEDGADLTDLILASNNYNFLLVSYNVAMANTSNNENLNKLFDYCYQMGYPFYGLTASTSEYVNDYIENNHANYEFFTTDETTLKTIIRSNPGLLVIKNGTIINKWHINDIPSVEELEKDIIQQSITNYKKTGDKYYIYTLILFSALIISLFVHIRNKYVKH